MEGVKSIENLPGERTISRRFYHEGREPKVVFFVRDKTYSGKISNYWRNGFSISTEEDLDLQKDDSIPLIYLDKKDKDCSVRNMKVLRCKCNETSGMSQVDVYAPDQETEEQLVDTFRVYMEQPPPVIVENFDDSRIPKFSGKEHYSEWAVNTRLIWARGVSGSPLDNITHSIFNPESLAGNIENYVGTAQIPIGLAGPVMINGIYTNSYIPVPIATTEGALVSSISRGAIVCNKSGGIETQVTGQQMVRAPVFFCSEMLGAINLEKWFLENEERIRIKAESVSSVAKVKRIIPFVFGDIVHLRFFYHTGDAAGQNMTTACTWVACEWIAKEIKDDPLIKFAYYNIEGNMSGDKKVNYQNFLLGRGVSVMATCHVPGTILEKVLRITVKDFIRGWNAAEVGALSVGMVGLNINFANVIAGIFTATGQDIASVHESSTGIFKAREEGDGILFTAHLPSLVIGTVGGGTKLPTQKDCLEIMGCYGTGKLFRLAEIIAATCLALDISTGSAIAANEFVNAHEKLGRNRPTKKLSKSEITSHFFNSLLLNKEKRVVSFESASLENNSGIISNLVKEDSNKLQGLFKYNLTVKTTEETKTVPAVLKLKTNDSEIIDVGTGLARLSGDDRLPGLFESQNHIFGFENSHIREIEFYRNVKPEILAFCPEIYGVRSEPGRELFAILMEDLSECSHLDTVNNPSLWDERSITTVLEDLASMHSVYLDRFEDIPSIMNVNTLNTDEFWGAVNFLRELTGFNASRFDHLLPEHCVSLFRDFLNNSIENLEKMHDFPMTLTHNDFNPRNICLRHTTEKPRLVIYDWELPCFQNPQHDLIEFLIYSLEENAEMDEFEKYIFFYMEKLEEFSGRKFSPEEFMKVLYLNALEIGVTRFNLYLLAHNIVKFSFLERVYGNLVNFIINTSAALSR
ncbi:MAG: phosphotransferase [bacterium]|nr:phosphotransferase [bacterium]